MRATALTRLTLIVLLLVAAGLFVWYRGRGVEAERAAAVETSRIRGWARANAAVGVSVLPKRVPAADDRDLETFRALPGFDAYATRCASCHALPDPGAYAAKRWIGKVEEMRGHIDGAGVMPPADDELEAVVRFLGAASDSSRTH